MKTGTPLPCDLTFLIEGEEEVGGKNLVDFLKARGKELHCDAVVVSDPKNTPELAAAMRRVATDAELRERLVKNGLALARRSPWDRLQQAVARELFIQGRPLPKTVDKRLAFDLDLFSRGGMRVLQRIEQQDHDVLRARPSISKAERVGLLLGSLLRVAFRKQAA